MLSRKQIKLTSIPICAIACLNANVLAFDFVFRPDFVNSGVQLAPEAENSTSTAQPETTATQAKPEPKRFGEEGSWRWQLLDAVATDFDGVDQGEFGLSLSWFFVDDLSIDFQIEGDYIEQPVQNTWGGGATILFRWHFISMDTWSIYGDAGSGLIATVYDTPSGGTSLNFTPQAGVGVSWEICPDLRMMVGARWYHISNANTGDTNPGRNSLMGYVMLSIPF
ncbi:MAG: acyloxyacyl hydrolase [Planctomycetota bacterium]|nr:acyloxyacyl hydrolase [Planctomycetota bacterium]